MIGQGFPITPEPFARDQQEPLRRSAACGIDGAMSDDQKPDYGNTLEAYLLAEYVTEGMTLIDAIRTLGLTKTTTYARLDDSPKFAAMMEKAREAGFDVIANDCLAIADDATGDTIDGKFGPRLDTEWLGRSRLRVDTRLKLLAKWHPKRYGEKLQIEQKSATVAIPTSDDPVAAQRAYEQFLKN